MTYIRTEQHRKLMSEKVKKSFENVDVSSLVKKGWKNLQRELDSIQEIYSKEETKDRLILNDLWRTFVGRGGNRILARYDLKLYKSVLEHTKILETASNRNFHSLTVRLDFIVKYDCDDNKIRCQCGKIRFSKYCEQCSDERYPSKKWFMKTYDDFWQAAFEEFLLKNKRFCKGYSKVSQELFWLIYERLQDRSDLFFAELNEELYVRITNDFAFILNRNLIFLDFVYKNKIIEFDGTIFHKDTQDYDKLRDSFTESLGYKTLRITEKEYRENREQVLQKCLEFLND